MAIESVGFPASQISTIAGRDGLTSVSAGGALRTIEGGAIGPGIGSDLEPATIPKGLGEIIPGVGGGGNVDEETAQRIAADAFLQSEIDALSGDVTGLTEVGGAVTDAIEVARAAAAAALAAARASLQEAIDSLNDATAEATSLANQARAEAAANLATALAAAQADASAAQAAAATALAAARTALETAIAGLQTAVDGAAAAVVTESDARQSADSAEANTRQTAVAALQTAVAQAAAAVVTEHDARVTADAAEATTRQAAIASLQTAISDATAALTAETSARTTADSAETSARQTAVSNLQTALNSATAALTAEQNTRATNDTAETNARTAAIAALQNSLDTVSAALTAEQSTRATNDTAETNARTSAISALQNSLNTVSAALTAEQNTRVTNDTAETNARTAAISALQTALDTTSAALTAEQSTRATNDTAETNARTAAISALQTALNSATAALTAEASTRATNDTAETAARQAAISSVQGQIDAANAAFTTEQNTRATNDAAEVSARQAAVATLQGALATTNAAVTNETNARVAADAAEASERNIVVSQLSTPGGCLSDPVFARSVRGAHTLPWGYGDWSYGTECSSIVAGKFGPNALRLDVVAGHQSGVYTASTWPIWVGAITPYMVVECDWEYISGDLTGAGLLVYSGANGTVTCNFASATPSPQANKPYAFRQVVAFSVLPNDATPVIVHIMGSSAGFSGSMPAKSFLIHRVQIRPASQQEIDTFTAGGPIAASISAAVSAEASTRATNDAAETAARQAAVSSLQTALNTATAALTAEQNTRATNDTAETNARTAAIAALQTALDQTTAALTTEQNARVAADSAETSARTTAFADLQNAINSVSALLTTEQNTRATNDSAETSARQAAIAALQTAVNAVNAAITAEQSTRATNDSAEAATRESVRASLQSGLDAANAAISTETNARVSAIGSEASQRLTLSSQLSATLNPKKTWKQATAPTFDQIFPLGVNACPLGNLDTGLTGLGAWTNTSRSLEKSIDLVGWTLYGGHTAFVHLAGVWAAVGTYECFDLNSFGDIKGIIAGATYEFSAYTGAHRCRGCVGIIFYDDAWTYKGEVWSGSNGLYNSAEVSGGSLLSNHKRLWVLGVAPAGATRVNLVCRADNQGFSGQGEPYYFVTRPYFGKVPAGQTTPTDWQPFEAPVWFNTAANNKPYTWSGINSVDWVETADTRIDSQAASISQLFSTTNGMSLKYGIQGSINGATGGFMFSGVLKNDGTVAYDLEISANVRIHGNVVIDGTIVDGKVGSLNNQAPTFVTTTSTSGSLTVALRGGQAVAIIAKAAATRTLTGTGGAITIKQGATVLDSETPNLVAEAGTGYDMAAPVVLMTSFTPPSDGSYTFSVNSTGFTVAPRLSLYVSRPYK